MLVDATSLFLSLHGVSPFALDASLFLRCFAAVATLLFSRTCAAAVRQAAAPRLITGCIRLLLERALLPQSPQLPAWPLWLPVCSSSLFSVGREEVGKVARLCAYTTRKQERSETNNDGVMGSGQGSACEAQRERDREKQTSQEKVVCV